MNRICLNLLVLLALGIMKDEVEKLGIVPKDNMLAEMLSKVYDSNTYAVIDVKSPDAGLVEAEGMGAARAMEARARRLAKVGMMIGMRGLDRL
jgi:hypothetical protein